MLLAFFESLVYILTVIFLVEFLLRMVSSENQESELHDIMSEIENAVILCNVEQIQDVYYLYDAQNDNFVGQAKTAEEIVELSEKLQKHIMIVDGKDHTVDSLKSLLDEVRS